MSTTERPATRLWREALDHVDALLQQSNEQRVVALHELAQSQPHLHPIVVSLMEAERDAASAGFLEPPLASGRSHSLSAGALVGPYRILSPLGAGGMGEVWLAKRDDGFYEGEVAIKTLHPYFAGGALRERFLREANLLGRLTHPNIARLLDAGVSAAGVVYLVIEYVRGVTIDQWCDHRRLTIEQRLDLVAVVGAAVAHAHSHLIVHRDIKPANILVTDEGVVKLLDFGVAKLLEPELSEATELTRLTGRVFTPEYAAPEQVLGEPVTTATDVYSLGVLLYVLLSSCRPYARDASSSVELEHAVVHGEPIRLGRTASAADGDIVAGKRSTTASRLRRQLSGDLENITARALAKQPTERYPSVLALADDVRRYLDHQPVQAHGESVFYRVRKFTRRHRLGVAVSAAFATAAIGGVAAVIWQAQIAQTEARKATAIRDFLVGIFERNSVAHPDGARARRTTAEELLAQSARQIRHELQDEPAVRAELLGVMAGLYSSLDMQREALPLLQDQLESQRQQYGAVSLPVAKTLSNLSYSQIQIGEYEQAEKTAQDAEDMFTALGDASSLEHAIALANLGQSAYRLGKGGDGTSQRYFQAGLDLIATHHPRDKWRIEMLLGLTRAANLAGDLEQALQYSQQAVTLLESNAVDVDGIVRGTVYQTTGNSLHWLNRYEDAERHMRKAVAEYEQAGGPEHSFTIEGKRELGTFLTWTGRREEAKRLLGEVVLTQERTKGPDDPELTAYARVALGHALLARGELSEAEPHLMRALASWKAANHPIWQASLRLATLQVAQGRTDAAEATLQGAEEGVVSIWGAGSWTHATAVTRIGQLRLAQGRLAEAAGNFDRVWNEWHEAPNALNANRANARLGRIRLHLLANETDRARELAASLLAALEGSIARPDMPDEEAAAHMLLGVALRRLGDQSGAQSHLQQAVATRERLDVPQSPWLAEARRCLAGECIKPR